MEVKDFVEAFSILSGKMSPPTAAAPRSPSSSPRPQIRSRGRPNNLGSSAAAAVVFLAIRSINLFPMDFSAQKTSARPASLLRQVMALICRRRCRLHRASHPHHRRFPRLDRLFHPQGTDRSLTQDDSSVVVVLGVDRVSFFWAHQQRLAFT